MRKCRQYKCVNFDVNKASEMELKQRGKQKQNETQNKECEKCETRGREGARERASERATETEKAWLVPPSAPLRAQVEASHWPGTEGSQGP